MNFKRQSERQAWLRRLDKSRLDPLWLASRPFRLRIGRVALFAAAFVASPYTPLVFVDAGSLTEVQYGAALAAALYPSLAVIWGFWKGHLVLGWLILWIQIIFLMFWVVYVVARLPVMPIHYADIPALLGDWLLGALGLFLLVLLTVGLVFWRWEKKWASPALQASYGMNPPARLPATTQKRPVLLLSAVGALLFFSCGLSLLALYPEPPSGDSLNGQRSLASWADILTALHMLSIAILASCLIYGLWRQQSDIVEAGCWLLLPGQLMTAAWPSHQVLIIAGTLAMLLLGLLVQAHQGFPMSLRHSRRPISQYPAGRE